MATLNELNALRTAAGMKPLKAWKVSKKALEEAITKLQSKTTTTQQLEATVAELARKSDVPEAALRTKLRGKTPESLTKDEAAKAAKFLKNEGVTIADIAKEMKIDAKVARAKLRRRTDVPRMPGKAWTFDTAQVKIIKDILRQDNRKKGGE